MHQKILVLDFGAQYSQLIARRVREANVYCELHPCDVTDEFIRQFSPKGIILSGGPASVTDKETPRAPQIVFELGVPVLGICYGMQTIAAQLGGVVEAAKMREFGYAEVQVSGHARLLENIQDRNNAQGHKFLDAWMSHGDKVTALPSGFKIMTSSVATPIAAMVKPQPNKANPIKADQFIAEGDDPNNGARTISRRWKAGFKSNRQKPALW